MTNTIRPLRLTARGYQVAQAIRDRLPFTTHGALKATTHPEGGLGLYSSGQRLCNDDLHAWKRDAHDVRYVVWSYATPIAWYTAERGWHVVKQKFSRTTSQHQSRLYLINHGEK